MNQPKKGGLGRGLTALLSDNRTDVSGTDVSPANSIAEINISDIAANPFQPRTEFEEAALEELADSIRIHGIIQPITVRKIGHGKYEIISGERRTRASIRAGLPTIPAYVRIANDQGMLELALIENTHRADLNPLEISISYQRLLDECKMNQEQLSERIGKSRSAVTNYIRLLKLPEEIQIALRDNQISMGHAKMIAGLDKKQDQLDILEAIIDEDLSVRKLEELIKSRHNPANKSKGKAKTASATSHPYKAFEDKFLKLWKTRVLIKPKAKNKGEITFSFNNEEELNSILKKFESPVEPSKS